MTPIVPFLALPEMSIKANSFMPEHIEIEYTTNSSGGDAGHEKIYHLKNTEPLQLVQLLPIGKNK